VTNIKVNSLNQRLSLVKNNITQKNSLPPQRNFGAEISAGSQEAFSTFVREKAKYYYYVAYRVTLNREAAEDAVQNAFAKLWEKRETIKDDGNLNAWLYRVVVNIAIDDKRRLKFAAELNEEIAAGENGDEILEKNDITEKVARTLSTLPPRHRAAVMMVYYDGVGQKEAAETMGINLKALESLLSRAKAVLKEKLA
jgi:RNA polymerase sigma-70 factor, ECF subfamily